MKDEMQTTPSWKPPILETDRLIIRPLEASDAPSIFEYAKNENVSKYTLWEAHKSLEDSLSFIKFAHDNYSRQVPEPFGITLKDNPHKVIGSVGCFWISKENRSMELGYAIGEEYWGQGIVVEASRPVLSYCFKEFSLRRIQCRCITENKASARVMEKLGMTFEGTLRSVLFLRNKFWDMHYYSEIMGP